MVPNEELNILTINLNLQRENNLYIKDKMPGPKVSITDNYGDSTVLPIAEN